MCTKRWITQYCRDRIDDFRKTTTHVTKSKIARELQITSAFFYRLYSATIPVSDKTTEKLTSLLGALPSEIDLMFSPDQCAARSNIVPEVSQMHRPFPTQSKRKDQKTYLIDRQMSAAILSGKYPSFYRAAKASTSETFQSDAAKDIPRNPGWKYSHYLQLGLIIRLEGTFQGRPVYVGYDRSAPRFKHTKGFAILWGCSFLCNEDTEKDPGHYGRMDDWLRRAEINKVDAQNWFWDSKTTIIRSVFNYKLRIGDFIQHLDPWGIVTRVQQGREFKRCYTNYASHLTLATEEKEFRNLFEAREKVAAQCNSHDIPLVVLSPNSEGKATYRTPETEGCKVAQKVFVGEKGQINEMDVVAWKALASPGKMVDLGSTQFHPGFTLV